MSAPRPGGAFAAAGGRVERHAELPSTGDRARDLLESLGPGAHLTAVWAERQTAGRGRMGRTWFSMEGQSLALSVALWPPGDPSGYPAYSIAAALAVREVLAELGLAAALKWPNDVLVEGRKICGVLLEGRFSGGEPQGLVLGIGLNLAQPREAFPEPIRDAATSVAAEGASPPPVGACVVRLLDALAPWLGRVGRDAAEVVRAAGEAWVHRPGDRLAVDLGDSLAEGRFAGVGPQGELLLETGAGRRSLRHGEVVRVRAGGAA